MTTISLLDRRKLVVRAAERYADSLYANDPQVNRSVPDQIEEIARAGLLTAALPERLGGVGLGTEAGGHLPLLRMLAAIGGGDLALGRLLEGHVNALILISSFGTEGQLVQAAKATEAGMLFGVWNTGEPTVTRVRPVDGGYTLCGRKTFASGAAFVLRPIVTAEREGADPGWQMVLPRMEAVRAAATVHVDDSTWQPLGMERSESFTIAFHEAPLTPEDLIGAPGDFYRDPLFRGGAIRFAAVQVGALERLARLLAQWLGDRRGEDQPYQVARMGEVALAVRQAVLWLEHAARTAESALWADAGPEATTAMVHCANMTRLAIERIATETMPRIVAGIGARGLLRPARFEQMLRDLTMYLRQANPDTALADVGRRAIQLGREAGECARELNSFDSPEARCELVPAEQYG